MTAFQIADTFPYVISFFIILRGIQLIMEIRSYEEEEE